VDKALAPHPPINQQGGCATLIHPTLQSSSVETLGTRRLYDLINGNPLFSFQHQERKQRFGLFQLAFITNI
jgi:hypothetical protein